MAIDKIIKSVGKTFTWLQYITWWDFRDTKGYKLIRFEDKVCADLILWIYVYENHIDMEFRNKLDAKIDKEFKDIKIDEFNKFLEDHKYIY